MRAIAIALSLLALVVPGALYAAWAPGATGAGSARARVMPTGPAPTPVVAESADVSVTWSAVGFTGGPPVDGYVVRRFNAITGTEAAVGGTCAGTVTSTGCTESGVPIGSWSYSVTAAHAAWRGAESTRVTVLVL